MQHFLNWSASSRAVSTFTEISGCFQPGQAKVGPRPTPLGKTLSPIDQLTWKAWWQVGEINTLPKWSADLKSMVACCWWNKRSVQLTWRAWWQVGGKNALPKWSAYLKSKVAGCWNKMLSLWSVSFWLCLRDNLVPFCTGLEEIGWAVGGILFLVDQISIKTPNPKCCLYWVYGLTSVSLTFSLVHLPPPPSPLCE